MSKLKDRLARNAALSAPQGDQLVDTTTMARLFAGGELNHPMPSIAPLDTRIQILDWDKGQIGGYLELFGSPDNLTLAGKVKDQPGYQGHYLSRRTSLSLPIQGIFLNADHHWDAGRVGLVTDLRHDAQGLRCRALLFELVGHLTLDGERLPDLLKAGRLYFCAELAEPQIAPDGELLSATLFGVALTAHPARRGVKIHA